MAALAITAASAYLGTTALAAAGMTTFLGLSGAAWGMMVGSAVVGALGIGQPDTQGPRLADTRVQISSYGASIPIAYGGVPLAGNVIWSTPLVETANEEGGKGGRGSVTTYSYTVSCAVALCEGPIVGIRRIWADAKLVYTAAADATMEEAAAIM